MKKALIAIVILLSVTLVEASVASLNVTWQLSTSTLRPSSISTILLTVTNIGIDLTDIVITSTAGPYVKITSGNKIDLNALASASSAQGALSIKIDDNAPSTTSFVYLQIDYYTGTSSYEKTLYVPITVIREPILQINNVNFSNNLEPGKAVTLSFDLKNEGLGDAKDIKVSLSQTSNFIVSDSSGESFINDLASSESKTLTFPITVSPDSAIGTTTIPVKLSYYDETRTNGYNDTKQIGTLITGKYNFIVAVDSQDVLTTDTSGYITIKFSNAGSEEADYLAIKTISSNNFDLSPTSIYVGNLKSDDYDSEKLLLKVGAIEPGDYPISLQLNYKDSFGKSYDEVYSVNAKVSSKAEYSLAHPTSNSPLIIIIIVFVVVVIFIAYKRGIFKRK
jgi:hypothetical protein